MTERLEVKNTFAYIIKFVVYGDPPQAQRAPHKATMSVTIAVIRASSNILDSGPQSYLASSRVPR